ncbi:hypothetical protein [Streptomyces tropicalis]|uniref:Uncharacterized protein n=1 Tax=Streptomyces tropicalis TaxID=3034234 RepID=A0ABT6A671_9ACTN|nr:hypothetical protein [Streptomyces tropicalis]MDF3300145.1 hypothetical protein [Streptomyces tropicalis]
MAAALEDLHWSNREARHHGRSGRISQFLWSMEGFVDLETRDVAFMSTPHCCFL